MTDATQTELPLLTEEQLKNPKCALMIGEKLLVRAYPKETQTQGGLTIPDQAAKNVGRAVVLAVGAEAAMPSEKWPAFRVGDTVVAHLHSFTPMAAYGDDCSTIMASDVEAIQVADEKEAEDRSVLGLMDEELDSPSWE